MSDVGAGFRALCLWKRMLSLPSRLISCPDAPPSLHGGHAFDSLRLAKGPGLRLAQCRSLTRRVAGHSCIRAYVFKAKAAVGQSVY